MLHVGLDLSRRRLDFYALDGRGATVAADATPPDADGLAALVRRFAGVRVRAAIESMNGARFVHDQLELAGWRVEIADAARVKGLAPLACKTDRIDARVLAELSWRELVPALWLPDPAVRAERERARFRLHLVRHRTSLKNRVESHRLRCRHELLRRGSESPSAATATSSRSVVIGYVHWKPPVFETSSSAPHLQQRRVRKAE